MTVRRRRKRRHTPRRRRQRDKLSRCRRPRGAWAMPCRTGLEETHNTTDQAAAPARLAAEKRPLGARSRLGSACSPVVWRGARGRPEGGCCVDAHPPARKAVPTRCSAPPRPTFSRPGSGRLPWALFAVPPVGRCGICARRKCRRRPRSGALRGCSRSWWVGAALRGSRASAPGTCRGRRGRSPSAPTRAPGVTDTALPPGLLCPLLAAAAVKKG